jgi:hypothetical protein
MRLRDRMGGAFDAAGFEYGDEVSHEWVEQTADISYPLVWEIKTQAALKKAINEFQFEKLAAVEALKEYCLVERKMYLRAVPRRGYLIVKPSDQTRAAVDDGMMLVTRGFKKTVEGLQNVNTGMLTPEEICKHAEVSARFGSLQMFVSRRRRRIMTG